MRNWGRRGILAGGAVLAGATLIRPREARAAKAMTVVLESEVTILDLLFHTGPDAPYYVWAERAAGVGLASAPAS